jgi:hypothetical protein
MASGGIRTRLARTPLTTRLSARLSSGRCWSRHVSKVAYQVSAIGCIHVAIELLADIPVGIQGSWMRYSWFSTSFDVPTDWTGERTHLNFGAVDYEAWVYINGQYAGFNRGGYFHFAVDVTDHLSTNGTNEL